MWTDDKKSEECVTLHSDFLEISYELNIKIKCVTPLFLGDVKNFLIPPRTTCIIKTQENTKVTFPLVKAPYV